jgi:hypothetical protein
MHPTTPTNDGFNPTAIGGSDTTVADVPGGVAASSAPRTEPVVPPGGGSDTTAAVTEDADQA